MNALEIAGYKAQDAAIKRDEQHKLNGSVSDNMYFFKREYAESVAAERSFNEVQTRFFCDGFSGLQIKFSNPRSANCVNEFKAGRKLLQDREVKNVLAKAANSFLAA